MLKVYHTNECRGNVLQKPVFARGDYQWLGNAYYFWQDFEFAEAWGYYKICNKPNYQRGRRTHFDIYEAELDIEFPSKFVIDTVFNETDYRNFLETVERFAIQYQLMIGKKPTLKDFNDFIRDKKLWKNVKAIRFQDLPTDTNKDFLNVKGFYYKKRIQIAVYDIKIMTKFTRIRSLECSK